MMRRSLLFLSVSALLLASCGSETDEGQDAQPTGAAAALASDSKEPSPNGVTVSDLVGTWIGDLVEPAKEATWSLRVTFGECNLGEECGDVRFRVPNWSQSGSLSCKATLTFEGTEGSAFMSEETIESGPCFPSRMAFVPMPGAYTIGVQEYAEGSWYTYGALRNEDYYFGYP
jgi:hypothetical protein